MNKNKEDLTNRFRFATRKVCNTIYDVKIRKGIKEHCRVRVYRIRVKDSWAAKICNRLDMGRISSNSKMCLLVVLTLTDIDFQIFCPRDLYVLKFLRYHRRLRLLHKQWLLHNQQVLQVTVTSRFCKRIW